MPIGYECRACKIVKPQPWWAQRCPGCGRWYDFKRTNLVDDVEGAEAAPPVDGEVVSFADAIAHRVETPRIEVGIPGVDHVLGGGLVPNALVLLTGSAGGGKTTLLLQVLQSLARQRIDCLYTSGEEHLEQLVERARRLGRCPQRMQALYERDLDAILDKVDETKPKVVVVDSLQTVIVDDLEQGSAMSIKVATRELMSFAKEHRVVFVLVGHVTKDGAIGGPETLAHLVDVALHLHSTGNDRDPRRELQCRFKNRFGPTPRSYACLMTDVGLVPAPVEDKQDTPAAVGAAS